MKIVRVPIGMLSVLGSSRGVADAPYFEFCRTVLSGGDYARTEYADTYRRMSATGARYIEADADRYLDNRSKLVTKSGPFVDVRCSLESDGTFLIRDGMHRSCNAAAVGETHIEVIVSQVSPLIVDIEQCLSSIYSERKLYQPIEHPWFDDWPVLRDDRMKMIAPVLDRLDAASTECLSRSALDIGSCSGGISRALWRRGYQTFGLEIDDNIIRVAETLNRILGTNVRYVRCNIFDVLAQSRWPFPFVTEESFVWQYLHVFNYSVVACFSLLHHWLNKSLHDEVRLLLRTIMAHTGVLFMDCPSAKDTFLTYDWQTAKPFYIEALSCHRCESLGIDKDGREVLAFYRGAP